MPNPVSFKTSIFLSHSTDVFNIILTINKTVPISLPLVPEPSAFEVELAIDKLKNHKSPGTDEIPAELIKAGVEHCAWRFINLLLLSGRRRNCLKSGRSRS